MHQAHMAMFKLLNVKWLKCREHGKITSYSYQNVGASWCMYMYMHAVQAGFDSDSSFDIRHSTRILFSISLEYSIQLYKHASTGYY